MSDGLLYAIIDLLKARYSLFSPAEQELVKEFIHTYEPEVKL